MDKSSENNTRDTLGCGRNNPSSTSPASSQPITLNIATTMTGGSFTVGVDIFNSVEMLKKVIAKKLKVVKDRICLLHRERELQDGTLKDNGLVDGSKIILVPNVETGLLAQRPENTVMQALESLNDSQVNDFLSGKSPLNLSMRLGDHMMLIQLQLSTMNQSSPGSSSRGSSQRSTRVNSSATASNSCCVTNTTSNNCTKSGSRNHHHHSILSSRDSSSVAQSNNDQNDLNKDLENVSVKFPMASTSLSSSASSSASTPVKTSLKSGSDLSSFLSARDYENLQNIVKNLAMTHLQVPARLLQKSQDTTYQEQPQTHTSHAGSNISSPSCIKIPNNSMYEEMKTQLESYQNNHYLMEQSPIKSLSNLVSTPIDSATIQKIPNISSNLNVVNCEPGVKSLMPTSCPKIRNSHSADCPDPISAKLTSCLCTRLNGNKSCKINNTCHPLHNESPSCVDSLISRGDDHPATITGATNLKTNDPRHLTDINSPISMPSSFLLHKTSRNPILKTKNRLLTSAAVAAAAGKGLNKIEKDRKNQYNQARINGGKSESVNKVTSSSAEMDHSNSTANTHTRTLSEASRSLTQTLRKLSKNVFSNKMDVGHEETQRKTMSGAIIESMKNHGKGIYSGTFSGTLNPALQDRYGQPKRDISTVIHILNDLLSATPQYNRRISFDTSSTAATPTPSCTQTLSSAVVGKDHQTNTSDICKNCSKTSGSACEANECNAHLLSAKVSPSSSCLIRDLSANGQSKKNRSSGFHVNDSNSVMFSLSSGKTATENISSTRSSGHHHHHHHHHHHQHHHQHHQHHRHHQHKFVSSNKDRHICTCRYKIIDESGERERDFLCNKCSTDMENNKTKYKMDQLRLVMQQRKQKREARKLKGTPYGARVVGVADSNDSTSPFNVTTTAAISNNSNSSSSATTITSSPPLAAELSPNLIAEEVDTAA